MVSRSCRHLALEDLVVEIWCGTGKGSCLYWPLNGRTETRQAAGLGDRLDVMFGMLPVQLVASGLSRLALNHVCSWSFSDDSPAKPKHRWAALYRGRPQSCS